ncbi:hypothetical protein DU75_04885, partial [Methanosarcina mazei]
MKGKGFVLLLIPILMILLISSYRYVRVSLYPNIKNIEKNRILRNVDNYNTINTQHFIIKYKDGDHGAAQLTASISEEYYDEVCEMYGYEPKDRVNIIIYDDKETLLKNTRLNKSASPIGIYYSGVINILSPKIWIHDNSNFNKTYEVNGPVVHEFAHLIIDEMTNGNYPMWLTEGMALYTESKTTGFEWPSNNLSYEEVSIEELNTRFDKIDQSTAYRRSFEVVKG